MNQLYPIFLKVHQIPVLIIGGGFVGYEKLSFLLKSSPNASVVLVATEISEEVRGLVTDKIAQVTLIERPFQLSDLEGKSLIIAATNDPTINQYIWEAAKQKGILVNVADTPNLCDFYLGSIVTKGNLKVAISTNGKSPTLAKRFRQLLENTLPEEIDELLENMYDYRQQLGVDFERKVKILNALTESLLEESI